MKHAQAATVDEATRDLKQNIKSRSRTTVGLSSGSVSLGWYRGKQAGVYDAYLTLRKKHRRAAEALLKAYGMDKDGDIVL